MNRQHRFFTIRRILSWGIAAYLVVWAAVLIFVSRVFGTGGAIAMSLILTIPFAIAVRMASSAASVRGREFAFLSILLVVVFGGSAFVIWIGTIKAWTVGMLRM